MGWVHKGCASERERGGAEEIGDGEVKGGGECKKGLDR